MIVSAIIKGITLGLVLSISVGPVIFAIIRQSLSNGHKGGLAFVLGVSFSDLALVLICNIFSQLFNSALAYEKIIGIGGSIFLIILGLYNLFFKKATTEPNPDLPTIEIKKRSYRHVGIFASGFFMNVLNPAVLLFWFAVTATILNDAQTYTNHNQYRILVFSSCLAFVLLFDILKVFLAGKIRSRLTPNNIHRINQISGIIFVVFGVILMYGIATGKATNIH